MSLRLNILTYVLNDNEKTLSIIETLLEKNNIADYKLFNDAGDFFKNFNENVHICIIDYYVPGTLTGMEVMVEVLKRNPRCYVIVMSGQRDIDVVIKFLNKGAYKYVDKNKENHLHILMGYLQKAITEINRDLTFYMELLTKHETLQKRLSHV